LFGEIASADPGAIRGISRNNILKLNDAGMMIEKWYYELENKFPDIKCHEMIVMPNHFHCIIENVGADLCVSPAVDHVSPADLRVCPDRHPTSKTNIMADVDNGADMNDVMNTITISNMNDGAKMNMATNAIADINNATNAVTEINNAVNTNTVTDMINVGADLCVSPAADVDNGGNRDDGDKEGNGYVGDDGDVAVNGNNHVNGGDMDNWDNRDDGNDGDDGDDGDDGNDGNDGDNGDNLDIGANMKNTEGEHVGSPLYRVVQWFKTMTTNEYIRGVKNNNWKRFNGKLWQRNYYEHIIRNEQSYHNITKYIKNNPAKWRDDNFHV
jgi:REP element-mobilizing transposase RayT